ncbi:MAG: hypothetical protein OCC49_00395 [Fibrobacterales bacterium]
MKLIVALVVFIVCGCIFENASQEEKSAIPLNAIENGTYYEINYAIDGTVDDTTYYSFTDDSLHVEIIQFEKELRKYCLIGERNFFYHLTDSNTIVTESNGSVLYLNCDPNNSIGIGVPGTEKDIVALYREMLIFSKMRKKDSVIVYDTLYRVP